jgi:hypothetical protein
MGTLAAAPFLSRLTPGNSSLQIVLECVALAAMLLILLFRGPEWWRREKWDRKSKKYRRRE